MERKSAFFDTTFRDGTQDEQVEVTDLKGTLRVLQMIDQIGVDYVEVGFASPAKAAACERIRQAQNLGLKAKVAAFGRTHPDDVQTILDLGAPVGVLVGKSRAQDADIVLHKNPAQNLKLIAEAIKALVAAGREVVYDAEHFLQAYFEDDRVYALETLQAAVDGGASCLVLCDTNGKMTPQHIHHVLTEAELPNCPLGIHTHNDRGRALANAEMAWSCGVRHIQGTIGGVGERTGNMDLLTFIPNIYLDYSSGDGIEITPEQLSLFKSLYLLVCDVLNITPNPRHPYVGESAFYTEAGMHESGLLRARGNYWHCEPTLCGNRARVGVTDQSGRANFVSKARELGVEIPESELGRIAAKHDDLVAAGANFGLADASLHLFLLRELGTLPTFFGFRGFRVIDEKQPELPIQSEASLRMVVKGKRQLHNADGDGPVNALDNVLRRTLHRFYPELATVHLVDYKVKIVDAIRGTAAKVRVLITFSDGTKTWSTMAVHENLIEASWEALLDGYIYKLMKNDSKPMARA